MRKREESSVRKVARKTCRARPLRLRRRRLFAAPELGNHHPLTWRLIHLTAAAVARRNSGANNSNNNNPKRRSSRLHSERRRLMAAPAKICIRDEIRYFVMLHLESDICGWLGSQRGEKRRAASQRTSGWLAGSARARR